MKPRGPSPARRIRSETLRSEAAPQQCRPAALVIGRSCGESYSCGDHELRRRSTPGRTAAAIADGECVMSRIRSLIATIAVLANAVAASAQGAPQHQPLPSAIERAFAKAYPKATIDRWVAEERQGQPVFEVESHEGTQKRDLIYTPKGQLLEFEEAVAVGALPAVVRQGVQKAYPHAALVNAERVVRGTISEYEVLLKGAAVKEVVVSATGVILKAQ